MAFGGEEKPYKPAWWDSVKVVVDADAGWNDALSQATSSNELPFSALHVAGPFPCGSVLGFFDEFPPERSPSVSETYSFNGRTLKWAKVDLKEGTLDLLSLLKPAEPSVAYLLAEVDTPEAGKWNLYLSTTDAAQVFHAGRSVASFTTSQHLDDGPEVIPLNMPSGKSALLVKLLYAPLSATASDVNAWGVRIALAKQDPTRHRIRVLAQLIAAHPDEAQRGAESALEIGDLFLNRLHDYDGAKHWYSLCADKLPASRAAALGRLAKLARLLNRSEDARRWSKQLTDLYADHGVDRQVDVRERMALGEFLYQTGRYDDAVDAFADIERLYSKGEETIPALEALATTLSALNEQDKAVRAIELILKRFRLPYEKRESLGYRIERYGKERLGTVHLNVSQEAEAALSRADDMLAKKRTDDAVELLHYVIRKYSGAVCRASFNTYESVRNRCVRKLTAMMDAGNRRYHESYDATASDRLREARAALSAGRTDEAEQILQETARCYPLTPAASRATLLLGDLQVEHGEPELAQVLYGAVAARVPDPEMAPRERLVRNLVQPPRSQSLAATDGNLRLGVDWEFEFPTSMPERVSTEQYWPRPAQNPACKPAVGQVAIGEDRKSLLFLNTLDNAYALDILTGRPVWSWERPRVGITAVQRLRRCGWTGYFAFSGRSPAFRQDLLFAKVICRSPWTRKNTQSIHAFQAHNGSPIWTTSHIPELSGCAISSEPVVRHGLVYCMLHRRGDLGQVLLCALDARTGKVRWQTLLGSGNSTFYLWWDHWLDVATTAPAPLVVDGVVYAVSSFGSVAAAEALSGHTKWVFTYHRRVVGGRSDAGLLATQNRQQMTPVLSGNVLVVAPIESSSVYGLDKESGKIIWALPYRADDRIVAAAGGRIFIAGQLSHAELSRAGSPRLYSVDAATGRIAWVSEVRIDPLSAYGACDQDHVYVGDRTRLHVIAQADGHPLAAYLWQPPHGGLALTIWDGKLIVTGQTAARCYSFQQQAPRTATAGQKRDQAANLLRTGRLDDASALLEALLATKLSAKEKASALLLKADVLAARGAADDAKAGYAALVKNAPAGLLAISDTTRADVAMVAAAKCAALGGPKADAAQAGTLTPPIVQKWSVRAPQARLTNPWDAEQGRIYLHTQQTFECWQAANEPRAVWRTALPSRPRSALWDANDIFLVLSDRVVRLDRLSGRVIYTHDPVRKGHHRRTRFASLGKKFLCLTQGSQGSLVTLIDRPTGRTLWTKELEGWEVAAAMPDANGVYLIAAVGKSKTAHLIHIDVKGVRKRPEQVYPSIVDIVVAFDYERKYVFLASRRGGGLCAWDLEDPEKLWEFDLPGYEKSSVSLSLTEDSVIADGYREDGDGLFVVDKDNGELTHRSRGGAHVAVGDLVYTKSQRWVGSFEYTMDARQWVSSFQREGWGPFLHTGRTLIAINKLSRRWRYYRTLHWMEAMDAGTGEHLALQLLPDQGYTSAGAANGYLFVTTTSGLYCYGHEELTSEAADPRSRLGDAQAAWTAALRERMGEIASGELTGPALNALRDLRDTMGAVAAPIHSAPSIGVIPEIDGTLGEWSGPEPMRLENAADFVPAIGGNLPLDERSWHGPRDLAAYAHVRWDGENVYVVVEVHDDIHFNPFQQSSLWLGDSIEIGIDSLHNDAWEISNTNDDFRFAFALSECDPFGYGGRAVARSWPAGCEAVLAYAVRRHPDGDRTTYEIAVPWRLIRRDNTKRPGNLSEMGFDVVVYDNDGQGLKGWMEWADGLGHIQDSKLYGTLHFEEIDPSRIEEYRRVVDALPDSLEAWRLLNGILEMYRGGDAPDARIIELERFVRKHPASRFVDKVLVRLQRLYATVEEENPQERCERLIASAGVPKGLAERYRRRDRVEQWVFLDGEKDAWTAMIELHTRKGILRAFWGLNMIKSDPEHIAEHRYIGPLPPRGQWAKLSLPLSALSLDDTAVAGLGFLSTGPRGSGVLWGATALVSGDDQTVLITDNVPTGFAEAKVDDDHYWQAWKWREVPASHAIASGIDGSPGKSYHVSDTEKALAYHLLVPLNAERHLFQPKAEVEEEAEVGDEEAYWRAIEVVPGTREGWAFFQKIVGRRVAAGDKRAALDEYESFVRRFPQCANTTLALEMYLRTHEETVNAASALDACAQLIKKYKVSDRQAMAFYTKFAPGFRSWRLLGPFPDPDGEGLSKTYGPEEKIDLEAKFTVGKEKKTTLTWREPTTSQQDRIDLATTLNGEKGAIAFAYTTFSLPEERSGVLFFGAEQVASVWVNGRSVATNLRGGAIKDLHHVPVKLTGGENSILIKTRGSSDGWAFFCRIAETNGRPIAVQDTK